MSEVRAPTSTLRHPPIVPSAIGVAATAYVVVMLVHPAIGLYTVAALALVSAAATAGLAFFIALGPTTRAQQPLADITTFIGVTAFAMALLRLPFAVMVVSGDGVSGLGDELAASDVLRGGDYQAVVARAAGLIVVIAMLRAPRRTATRAAVAAGGLLVACSYLFTGHFRSLGPWWLVIPAGVAHVAATSAWFGGLIGLGIALHHLRRDPNTTAQVLRAFARNMTAVISLLVAGGSALAVAYLPDPGALVHTAYGQVLVLKIGLFAAVLVVSTANHVRLVPLAEQGHAAAVHVLRRHIAVEQLALMAVLVITALLARQNPGN